MRRSVCFIALVLALIFSLCFTSAQSFAAKKIYEMGGEITAIDFDHFTVVIEVPLGEKLFTVAGHISTGAVLKKGARPAGLADFRVGDWVKVKWEATETGHVILSIRGR